jgi:LemA protein
MVSFLVILVIVLVIAFFFVNVFNRLGKARILTQEGWSSMGTFLRQRYELIPDVVNLVTDYAGDANKTLVDLVKARSESISAMTPETQILAAKHTTQVLIDLKSLADQYPELKHNENFQQLQTKLDYTEEKVRQSRRYYDGTARNYNQELVAFPNNLVAGFFGFQPVAFFLEDETDSGVYVAQALK